MSGAVGWVMIHPSCAYAACPKPHESPLPTARFARTEPSPARAVKLRNVFFFMFRLYSADPHTSGQAVKLFSLEVWDSSRCQQTTSRTFSSACADPPHTHVENPTPQQDVDGEISRLWEKREPRDACDARNIGGHSRALRAA